jgi:hypothetical protein
MMGVRAFGRSHTRLKHLLASPNGISAPSSHLCKSDPCFFLSLQLCLQPIVREFGSVGEEFGSEAAHC